MGKKKDSAILQQAVAKILYTLCREFDMAGGSSLC
jgi:hypothetical protein